MSYWNYRVIRKHDPDSDTISHQVYEMYYADDGSIEQWTEDPVQPYGETAAELREKIKFFLQAFRCPILGCKEVDGESALTLDEDTGPPPLQWTRW